jgi:hypothetical protein
MILLEIQQLGVASAEFEGDAPGQSGEGMVTGV